MVERIRATLAAMPAEAAAGDIHITVSLGLAMAVPGEAPQALINRANEALYAAKRGGRNRMEPAPQA